MQLNLKNTRNVYLEKVSRRTPRSHLPSRPPQVPPPPQLLHLLTLRCACLATWNSGGGRRRVGSGERKVASPGEQKTSRAPSPTLFQPCLTHFLTLLSYVLPPIVRRASNSITPTARWPPSSPRNPTWRGSLPSARSSTAVLLAHETSTVNANNMGIDNFIQDCFLVCLI